MYTRKYRRYLAILAALLVLAGTTLLGVTSATAQAARPAHAIAWTSPVRAAHPSAVLTLRVQAVAWAHHVHHVHHVAHLRELARIAAARQAAAIQLVAEQRATAAHTAHEAHLARIAPAIYVAPAAPSSNENAPSVAPAQPAASTYTGGSGFQRCVIAAESGGNSQVMNSSGHYGLYQFSESTWEEYGGSAATFGNASVAEQNQVFDNAMATPAGASNWSAYDGCTDAVVTGAAPANATLDAVIRPATAVLDAHQRHLAHLAYLASHRVTLTSASTGQRILATAETRTGDWYVYGADGPATFDCSGLVYWASHEDGVDLPRTTYELLDSSLLVPTSHPVAGDLAFFGPGHVEFVYNYGAHETFGAQQTGTRVGVHTWGGSWAPTEFFAIR
jgi:cell wall-associated NlpC family hydrolase